MSNPFLYSLGVVLILLGFALLFHATEAHAFVGSYQEETSNRSVDGTYQNTTSEDLFVNINFLHPAGTSITAEVRIGANSPPTEVVDIYSRTNVGAARKQVSLVVPAGYYYGLYMVSATGSGLSIEKWWEYTSPTITSGGGGSGTTTIEQTPDPSLLSGFGVLLFLIGLWFPIWFFRRPQ